MQPGIPDAGDREPVWRASADAIISGADDRVIAVVRTFRDITGQKQSQARRAAAARVSADLANGDDLATLLSVAQHGFDLLAQAFALSVDRLVAAEKAATTNASLKQAIDSHRSIGQAVGILVEMYRLQPGQAFDRLRQASQNRNLKVRELAARIVETGADPETA